MLPKEVPAGTYAIRVTRTGEKKFLIFETIRGVAIDKPIDIAPGPEALREAIEPLIGRPFHTIQQEHMVPIGSDVLILIGRKGDEDGVSGRLRKQEANKQPQ